MEDPTGHNGQEKEWKADNERLQTGCDAADNLSYIHQDAATFGGRHAADKNRSAVWSRSRSASSRSGVDAQENGGAGYRVANPDVMDCDVAAAFDHVSHHRLSQKQ